MNLPSLTLPSKPTTPPSNLPKRKLLKHHSGNDYILEIDHSSLEILTNCDRKAQWQLVYGRIPHERSALVYGSAIHSALEHLYRDNITELQPLYEAMVPHFENCPPGVGEWRTLDHATTTIAKYLEHYKLEQFEVLTEPYKGIPSMGTKMVEIPFAIPLTVIEVNDTFKLDKETLLEGGDPFCRHEMALQVDRVHIVWTGKIDILAKTPDGRFGIVDHKTFSIGGDSYFKGFELSQQFLGYVWSAEKLLERELHWALVNGIYGRQPAATKETQRKHDSERFQRRYYHYRRDQIEEWPQSIIAICEDFIHRLVEGFFPMKTTHCVAKFGLCPFHQVCTEKPEHRLMILNSNLYSDNTWSPLNS